MAGNAKDAWEEVGERFAEWGRMLAERYRRRGEELGTTPEEERRKLDEGLTALIRQLDLAFASVGGTLRDPVAKESLKNATRALSGALSTTLSEAGGQIRSRFGSSGSSGPSDRAD